MVDRDVATSGQPPLGGAFEHRGRRLPLADAVMDGRRQAPLGGAIAHRGRRPPGWVGAAALGLSGLAWLVGVVARLSPGALGWAQAPAPVVDHRSVQEFLSLGADEIAAAAGMRMLFIDHSVGQNIHEALDCTASPSLEAAPSRCKRFEHVVPAFSADPRYFRFGRQYDRSRWVYHYGASSYWREWPDAIEALLSAGGDWDVVIPMPSYLVAPNGGWQPIEGLEARHPGITFVYATSSLPRGAAGGTEHDLVMQQFNAEARAYALAHAKPLLDVADLLSHDYEGQPCYDSRDGVEYCQAPGRCENLPDDGHDIPAICPHYTTELYGGHLGNVSGGGLRMSQAVWLLMARLAARRGIPEPTASPPPSPSSPPPSPEPTGPSPLPSSSATAVPPPTSPQPTAVLVWSVCLPLTTK